LVAVTATLGMTAPEESFTVPEILPPTPAAAVHARTKNARGGRNQEIRRPILNPTIGLEPPFEEKSQLIMIIN
jgi:hypothetical protein